MSEQKIGTKRAGGRQARKALRSAPQPENQRPVKPGMEGGKYLPLKSEDLKKIHQAVLNVLHNIGIADATKSGIELMTKKGCVLGQDGRIRFPPALVEDTIANAARNITLYARDENHNLHLKGYHTYFGTAGAAVHVYEPEDDIYRDSSLKDLYDAARIVDQCEHIHLFQRPLVARDMQNDRDLDINTAYACIAGTKKHIGTSFSVEKNLTDTLPMLHDIAGSEKKWRQKPFISMSCCFVVPPLKFAQDACACLEIAAKSGMPILLLAAGQAGATSPAALAGAVVEQIAECIAGLVYINAIVPKAPAILGPWPFVSDLRTGAMSGGSGEQALLSAACGQMGRFYDLPTGVPASMSDAKRPDVQAGYEKGLTVALSAMSGANIIYESAGMHASILGFCHESLLIDNDMIGAVNRNVRGIEVNDYTLAIEVMKDTCINGPGHFLGQNQTLELMQTEYLYPDFADRTSPKEWNELGKPELIRKATKKKNHIIKNYKPQYISKNIDEKIRKNFPIKIR